ncbi:DegT/DnrJ/EryC1/StrS family aminotransferase [Marimonas arenosa]|uniref:DegT/DnrJ/EryC1/StrS family aminotransferase n=1 Tax=Marimonas arenosa TaxID=1795305 RepID=A0AAE3WDJ8_9RHOB|nr:DegT/DnrJ/EryC1/StrS family aminotransferase [Marimonas arenosa]
MVADKNGGVPGLFANRRIGYSFNTRAAIRKACDLLKLKPGDEVLAPAYNCGSELDPLLHAGLKVTLYPVNRQARIDLAGLQAKITEKTRAIYLTHYFGFLQPETEALRELCNRSGLYLIEDCALSLLSGTAPAEGYSGDVAVFCFYKFFPVLSGGALVINSASIPNAPRFVGRAPAARVYKERLRLTSGMLLGSRLLSGLKKLRFRQRSPETAAELEARPDMPSNYYFDPRLSDARIDLFAKWPMRSFNSQETIQKRRENYLTYLDLLAGIEGVEPLFPQLPETTCPQSFPILVKRRDQVAAFLIRSGIDATPWWAGYNRHLVWNEDCGDAIFLKNNILSLPLHQGLSADAIARIVGRLHHVIQSEPNDQRN